MPTNDIINKGNNLIGTSLKIGYDTNTVAYMSINIRPSDVQKAHEAVSFSMPKNEVRPRDVQKAMPLDLFLTTNECIDNSNHMIDSGIP